MGTRHKNDDDDDDDVCMRGLQVIASLIHNNNDVQVYNIL
jgi:hypothetical protein